MICILHNRWNALHTTQKTSEASGVGDLRAMASVTRVELSIESCHTHTKWLQGSEIIFPPIWFSAVGLFPCRPDRLAPLRGGKAAAPTGSAGNPVVSLRRLAPVSSEIGCLAITVQSVSAPVSDCYGGGGQAVESLFGVANPRGEICSDKNLLFARPDESLSATSALQLKKSVNTAPQWECHPQRSVPFWAYGVVGCFD